MKWFCLQQAERGQAVGAAPAALQISYPILKLQVLEKLKAKSKRSYSGLLSSWSNSDIY